MIQQDRAKIENVFIQSLQADWINSSDLKLDVLRLDLVHPVISGNKWFKLKYYLEEARVKGFNRIATFGGAYSNHIVATAYACKLHNLTCTGIIRGEEPQIFSPTLLLAKECGMQLKFVTRSAYKDKEAIKQSSPFDYWINEGGYGSKGVAGAMEIMNLVTKNYSHIICAVGTGTTLAGIIQTTDAEVIGISVMKGNEALNGQVKNLLEGSGGEKKFSINHDFHFGGYAKFSEELLDYMNAVWLQHQLPTDFVYTAKAMYATQQMILNKQIPPQSRVLLIHTGGLQGNLSLNPGRLIY